MSGAFSDSKRYPAGNLLLGVLVGALLVIVAGLLALPSFLTHRGDWPLERAIAEVAKDLAVPRSAASLQPPGPLDDRRALARGREAYTGSCAVCHGSNGDGQGVFGAGLYPAATDLRSHDTQEKSDGQLFWIVKNGLSFGGMPAFADQYSDDAIWAMVGYVRTLAGRGTPAPLTIATPTTDELAAADSASADPVARGTAVYLAQGCQLCHGARGAAPGDLALGQDRRGMRRADELARALRDPPAGMPAYSAKVVDDADLADLLAYLQTFPPRRGVERRGA